MKRGFKEIIYEIETMENSLAIERAKARGKYTEKIDYFERKIKFLKKQFKDLGAGKVFKVTMWEKDYLLVGFEEKKEVEEFAFTVWGIAPSQIEEMQAGFNYPYSKNT